MLRPEGGLLVIVVAPRDGRPFPLEEHTNDLVPRHTVLLTGDAGAAARGWFAGQG